MFFHKKEILSAILSLTIVVTMFAAVPLTANAETSTTAAPTAAGVSYAVYGQNYAWQSAKANGAQAGTVSQSKRIEALKISLTGTLPSGASVIYQVHGQKYGWSQSAKADAAEAGTEHQSKRIEALKITLKGMSGYQVKYRVHQQTYGWSDWVTTTNGTDISDAAAAGVTGKSKRVEAIEIKIEKSPAADVSTADELNKALADSNITTINLKSNITASPTITRSLTINFSAYTLTGDMTFKHTETGTSLLTGNMGNRIIGSLTVDTGNASFDNGIEVSGKVNIANVEIDSWAELATGNMIYITDPDGSTLDITGHPAGVEVTASAGGDTSIDVGAGGTVDSFASSVPVTVAVAPGGTVTAFTAGTGAAGSIITNSGTIGSLTSSAAINLIANVAPGSTLTSGSGSVTVTGIGAGGVVVTQTPSAPPAPPAPETIRKSTIGIPAPKTGAVPVSTIAETSEYTATISWSPAVSAFNASTVYTATITITPKTGYTLAGVPAKFFNVDGATTTTNDAGSGTVTAVFPKTSPADSSVDIAQIDGVTAPATGGTPVSTIADASEYTATISWSLTDAKFNASTVYTATITITPKVGYTLAGVPANFFKVAGATTTTNDAGSGTVTAVFPKTGEITLVDTPTGGPTVVTIINPPVVVVLPATETKVTVTTQYPDYFHGQYNQFSAVVEGSGESQDVTWLVQNQKSKNTSIDANGKLTVGDDETADLTVIATSVTNPNVSGSFYLRPYVMNGISLDVHVTTADYSHDAEVYTDTNETVGCQEAKSDGNKYVYISTLRAQLIGTRLPAGASIICQIKTPDGWQSNLDSMGHVISQEIQAVRMTLVNMPNYSIRYTVHDSSGWHSGTTTSETKIENAAIAGSDKLIDEIQVSLVPNVNP